LNGTFEEIQTGIDTIKAEGKRGVHLLSSPRLLQQVVGLREASLCHAPDHFDDALFRRFFDHRSNQDLWPRLQRTPPTSSRFRDLFPKRAPDTVGVR
jgi:hypothetical protein